MKCGVFCFFRIFGARCRGGRLCPPKGSHEFAVNFRKNGWCRRGDVDIAPYANFVIAWFYMGTENCDRSSRSPAKLKSRITMAARM